MSRGEGWRRLNAWVNGEREPRDQTLFQMEKSRGPRAQLDGPAHEERERYRLRRFLSGYPVAAVLICMALVGALVWAVMTMPAFGEAGNPVNNEVAEHYLEYTQEETGATNAVTGMILTYRGFDTLGESCVLFLAVTCVMMLLEQKGRESGDKALSPAPRESRRHPDAVLRQAAGLLIPFIFLFALYVLFNGESSPGGGFSGGTILGCGLILYAAAFGPGRMSAFFNRRVYGAVRTFGLLLYALLYGYYIFMGANGLENHLSIEHGGLIMPIDVAVGLVVACTVYGFYSLFARGEV